MKLTVILVVLAGVISRPGAFVWASYIDAADRLYSEAECRADAMHSSGRGNLAKWLDDRCPPL